MNIREIRFEGVFRIHLSHDVDGCWVSANTVMNILVP
jgi:hypothetical protein